MGPQLPVSILDTDLYKLTMQQAVLQLYPDVSVRYQFNNRRKAQKLSQSAFQDLQASVQRMEHLRLTADERAWLEKRCPYFKSSYLDYLQSFQFKPAEQVTLNLTEDSDLELAISGNWAGTILYETPLMALISQTYFEHVDTKWDYVGQKQQAYEKACRMLKAGCAVSEFGTRRRRSYLGHKLVMEGLVQADRELGKKDGNGFITGTSNVHFAHLMDLAPVGTIAHEFTMGLAAMEGYEGANGLAMRKWDEVYPDGQLTIALTDTFSSKAFFGDFKKDVPRAQRWRGVRQDSADPFEFARIARDVYQEMGIDPKTKTVVHSDGLDVDKVIELQKNGQELGIGVAFGVGTTLTNDYVQVEQPVQQSEEEVGSGATRSGEPSQALNIVIKLWEIQGKPCVKISDEINKNSGDAEAVKSVKVKFGLE